MATTEELKESIEIQSAKLFRRVRDSKNLDDDALRHIDSRLDDLLDLVDEWEGTESA